MSSGKFFYHPENVLIKPDDIINIIIKQDDNTKSKEEWYNPARWIYAIVQPDDNINVFIEPDDKIN